jgi:hypothetical protein
MSKGIVTCVKVAILILFTIGVIAVLYKFGILRFVEFHIIVEENEVERRTINMANVLLSYDGLLPPLPKTKYFVCSGSATECNLIKTQEECKKQVGCAWCPIRGCIGTTKPCSERDESDCGTPDTTGCSGTWEISSGEYYIRGIFDASKLNKMAIYLSQPDTKDFASALIQAVTSAKELSIGYPNTYTIFVVVDLSKCSPEKCDGWVGAIKGPFSIDATYAKNFIDCLANHVDTNVGSVFKATIPYFGIFTLWQPWDLMKCGNIAMSGLKGIFFGYSTIPTISTGYPVLIRYSDNSLHIGRLYVGVWQWA